MSGHELFLLHAKGQSSQVWCPGTVTSLHARSER